MRSRHTEGLAFDFAFWLNGRITWRVPEPYWLFAGQIAARYGWRQGVRTSRGLTDLGHLELPA